ncbi:MAG: hypothetical protein ACREFZ_02690 [Acetobacteraceae bacterium]
MTLPVALPAWVPWWLPFLVLVGAALYLLAFLIMPFSVFGVKGRLDSIEARLDEIHAEIRRLALRLPEPLEVDAYDDDLRPFVPSERAPDPMRPPIPPAPEMLTPDIDLDSVSRRLAPPRGGRRSGTEPRTARAEPHLDWPR